MALVSKSRSCGGGGEPLTPAQESSLELSKELLPSSLNDIPVSAVIFPQQQWLRGTGVPMTAPRGGLAC